jgi:hypothetical protein
MKSDNRLLFGPLAAALLGAGIVGLAFWVPGYSQVHQTVSEIGEMDSPARIPFTIMLCAVFGWCAGIGLLLMQHRRTSPQRQPV